MGYRASWIAVEGMSEDTLLDQLGWHRTGAHEDEHVDPGLVVLRRSPWTIVFADGTTHFESLHAEHAGGCSASHRVLFLLLSDTSMRSEIRCFEGKREVWSVVKAAGAPTRPVVEGAAPDTLRSILTELELAQQTASNDVDHWYEAAPKLGQQLTGFRHDEPESDDGFREVAAEGVSSDPPPAKPGRRGAVRWSPDPPAAGPANVAVPPSPSDAAEPAKTPKPWWRFW